MKQLMSQFVKKAVIASVVCMAGIVHAQSAQTTMKVYVPFEFSVGSKTFPAGNYRVSAPIQHFVELRDEAGHKVAGLFSTGVETLAVPTDSHLTFAVEGDRHTLVEVWHEGVATGEKLQLSKSDRAELVAKRAADAQTVAQTIINAR